MKKNFFRRIILSTVALAALLGATPKAEASWQDFENMCVDSVQTCARSVSQQIPHIANSLSGLSRIAIGTLGLMLGTEGAGTLMHDGFTRTLAGTSTVLNIGYNEFLHFCSRHTVTDKIMRLGVVAGAYAHGGPMFAFGMAMSARTNNTATMIYREFPAAAATKALGDAVVPLAVAEVIDTGKGSPYRTFAEKTTGAAADWIKPFNSTIPLAESAALWLSSKSIQEKVMFGPAGLLYGRVVKPMFVNAIRFFTRT
ncbi:MAG: hypothetical protein J0G29_04705 [Alphaproteobacteria bacterium]|nr:hypothetical protein [Alphaproteobacteria bacterium]OJV45132.1 MAG: hypothetical protein BGO28_03870 [Alphaproteobacteria bacterium 43-37]